MEDIKYHWVRVFDYSHERDGFEKGTLLDEFYLKDVNREEAKKQVKERYCGHTHNDLKFAKPKKKDGIYAVVMDSTKFYYDRFYVQVDTYCFWCHAPVKGKASEYPREYIGEGNRWDYEDLGDLNKTAYFCCYNCKSKFSRSQRSIDNEGEFQEKEEGKNGAVFGYIYLIYNRIEGVYYVGQTRFMPFFRWQEHIKDGSKGEISDLSFSVLAEISRNNMQNEAENQLYLNSIEAWWIRKYEHEGHKVFNISKPKITIEHLKERFNDMVAKQGQMSLELVAN